MRLDHARRFNAAVVGKRLVPVRCDHCGCESFYELARVGSGAATADRATSPVRMRVVDATRGIVRLRSRNDEYRRCVAEHQTLRTKGSLS